MQENEFEKKVRETMNKFKIDPSDSVWNKVEQHIPKKERRRRWVIFSFLFAGLVLGYFIYNNYYNNPTEIKSVRANNQNDKTRTDSTTKNREQANASIPALQNNITPKING